MTVKKYERKLTPSGLSDNGVWKLSENTVDFPASVLKKAIVETVNLKEGSGYGGMKDVHYFNAFRVVIDGNSWNVEKDPRKK